MISKNFLIFILSLSNNQVYDGFRGYPVTEIPKKFIMKFLPENPIILEAGSYNGNDTVEMAKLWPNSKIYTFEPIPQMFQQVKNKTKSFSHVFCYQLALNDETGNAEFFLGSNEGISSSLLQPAQHLQYFPSVKFDQSITVKTITIDDWAKRENIKYIDFMWLDIQGKEPDVLLASPEILKTVKVIYSEISRAEIFKGQIIYPAYKKFLQSQGFTEIYEDTLGVHGNALFIRSDKNQVQLYTGK